MFPISCPDQDLVVSNEETFDIFNAKMAGKKITTLTRILNLRVHPLPRMFNQSLVNKRDSSFPTGVGKREWILKPEKTFCNPSQDLFKPHLLL